MTEIIEKAGEVVKGSSFMDKALNKETFEMLDQHAHTLDQVGTLMTKANALLSNPVIGQIMTIAMQMKEQKSITGPVDAWSAPTMSEIVGGAQPMPQAAPVQPMTQIAPMPDQAAPIPNNAAPEPPKATSVLHNQVKDEIDKLSEDQLMDLLMKMSSDPEIVEKVENMQKKDEVKDDEKDKPKHTE